jgi:hypothetical protein
MKSLLMCETKAPPNLYLGKSCNKNDIEAYMGKAFMLPVCETRARPYPIQEAVKKKNASKYNT